MIVPVVQSISMSLYYTNIYKTARNRAGMTQEAAAEALDISVESMQIVVPSSENFT